MSNGKVLILDDNANFAETLAGVLTHHNFEARWADDPEKARELAAEFRPETLVIDYALGSQTGMEVALSFLEQKFTRQFILLTGRTEISEKDLPAALVGRTVLLHKPVEIQDLLGALSNFAAR